MTGPAAVAAPSLAASALPAWDTAAGYLLTDIPDDVYHDDTDSLSSSGAKLILTESPQIFHAHQTRSRKDSRTFDIGHAAHTLVLGTGAPIVEITWADWRTKAAKEAVAEARAAGAVPLKSEDYGRVIAMRDALLASPIATELLSMPGWSEISGYVTDPETGEQLRFRPDRLSLTGTGFIINDFKTAATAKPTAWDRHAAKYAYHQQKAWYIDCLARLYPDARIEFLNIAQEKDHPYAVSILDLDEEFADLGRRRNRRAINLWHRCRIEGDWPGWDRDIHTVSAPKYALYEEETA